MQNIKIKFRGPNRSSCSVVAAPNAGASLSHLENTVAPKVSLLLEHAGFATCLAASLLVLVAYKRTCFSNAKDVNI
jgi:hypothetical protein